MLDLSPHRTEGLLGTTTSTLTQLLSSADIQVQCCFTFTETIRTIRDGESRTATETIRTIRDGESRTATETIRTIRDGESRTATSTFTQLLSSLLSSRSLLLYVHRDHKNY